MSTIVYGKGKTGKCLANMLDRQGVDYVFYDDVTGFGAECDFESGDTVILSPGVKPNAKGLLQAQSKNCKIIGELEYCTNYNKSTIVSVTGTNGKTTTCQLIYHILTKYKKSCYLLGNGGIPFSNNVLDTTNKDVVVLESSSFQLCGAKRFAPKVSLFTNLATDHLDYHQDFSGYVSAKLNNFVHQGKSDFALFNSDDHNVTELSKISRAKVLYYSCSKLSNCYYDGTSVVCDIGKRQSVKSTYIGKLVQHNVANVCGAILCCRCLGVPLSFCVKAVSSYKFLPHRLQLVGSIGKVFFVDDSKATNVHATVSALSCYANKNVALIVGGSDKNESFDGLFENIHDNVKVIVATGQTAQKISDCGAKHNIRVVKMSTIDLAVEYCYKTLKDIGGYVLMSNACASFDKFSGYCERGEYFTKVVGELVGKE